MVEIWKDVPEYEDLYEVSNKGKVRSLSRIVTRKDGRKTRISERILKAIRDGQVNSYPSVTLHKQGRCQSFFVHQLVLLAFVGPCPEGMEGCHEDRNRQNNWVGNLRWDTPKGNSQDRIRHGTHPEGEKNGYAKLTQSKVVRMRKLWESGEYSRAQLAKLFDIRPDTVKSVVTRRRWKHI